MSNTVNKNKTDSNTSSEVIAVSLRPIDNVCELPGWSNADFTRTGKLGVWNISRIMESDILLLPPLVAYSLQTSEGISLISVVTAQKTVVSKDLYRLSASYSPILCKRKFGYMGKTSLSLIMELSDRETGVVLARCERQVVYIGTENRKAHPLPKYLERFKDQYPRYEFVVEVRYKPTDLSKVYVAMIKIAASDMDFNYHTNQSMYYRFSLDAAYEAWKSGFLRNFIADPCEYGVRCYEGKHVRETFAGDQIYVTVWEDDNDKLTLHFELRNIVGNAYIMYQKIVFFPLSDSKL